MVIVNCETRFGGVRVSTALLLLRCVAREKELVKIIFAMFHLKERFLDQRIEFLLASRIE